MTTLSSQPSALTSPDVVIRAENLGKKYIIGHQTENERYTALRDVVGRTLKGLARSAKNIVRGQAVIAGDMLEEFWALKDINFEIRRGEVVGIIGRNGAGKSTLLKILSRITEPSAGRVTICGRVASLLEVGTGFHPELTGRENIYLNGAILGMTRAEIRRKFDEIVDFAGVEKFLDTPVKRYSSGMYVRLAFAVAAHLEPEILVVDEVLAVGDAEFQKKCLGKMEDVAGHGRTVLFVSHNMGAVNALCPRSIFLENGFKKIDDETAQCVEFYLNAHSQLLDSGEIVISNTGSKLIPSLALTLLNEEGEVINAIEIFQKITLRLVFHAEESFRDGGVAFFFFSQDGQMISKFSTRPGSAVSMEIVKGKNAVECTIESFNVSSGACILGVGISIPSQEWLFHDSHLVKIQVLERDVFSSGLPPKQNRYLVPMKHQWNIRYE